MSRGGKRPNAGRKPTGRKPVRIRLTEEERARLEVKRRGKHPGVFIGEWLMSLPLRSFERFDVMSRCGKKPNGVAS